MCAAVLVASFDSAALPNSDDEEEEEEEDDVVAADDADEDVDDATTLEDLLPRIVFTIGPQLSRIRRPVVARLHLPAQFAWPLPDGSSAWAHPPRLLPPRTQKTLGSARIAIHLATMIICTAYMASCIPPASMPPSRELLSRRHDDEESLDGVGEPYFANSIERDF